MASKLIQGLTNEGFAVKRFTLKGGRDNIIGRLYSDLRLVNRLRRFEVIVYIGSLAWLSHLILRRSRKLLFVHGLVIDEQISMIESGTPREKIVGIFVMGWWLILRALDSIDVYICHSLTSRERNRLPTDAIILPQFTLPSEVVTHGESSGKVLRNQHEPFRIVTYRSHASSPRLIEWDELKDLTIALRTQTQKKFELVVVDPNSAPGQQDGISVIPFLRRDEFLKLVRSSDMYLERCKDEELGFGSLESGLLGTPVVKVTRSAYLGREDYSEKEVVSATTIGGLAMEIARFIDDAENLERSYSSEFFNFVTRKRAWDEVKPPLLAWIRSRQAGGSNTNKQ